MPEATEPEQQNKILLENTRAQEAKDKPSEPEPELPRMGWGIFLGGSLGIALQTGLAWIADAAAGTVVALPLAVLCWTIGALISGVLYLITKKYRQSMKEVRRWWDLSLIFGAVPFLGSVPLDFLALAYAFIKTRSKIVQEAVNIISKK